VEGRIVSIDEGRAQLVLRQRARVRGIRGAKERKELLWVIARWCSEGWGLWGLGRTR
jgi:hypothetical protein